MTRKSKTDQLPPHSPEAEQGVLGCVLLSPDCIDVCISKLGASGDAFYDLRHRTIYAVLIEMHGQNAAIDLITLQQRLKDKQLLDQVGGIAYLMTLPECVPSAANLPTYLEILDGKLRQRQAIAKLTRATSLAYQFNGSPEELQFAICGEIGDVLEVQTSTGGTSSDLETSLAFNPARDGNNIIGVAGGKTTRYLCRGYAVWLIGPSGVGKSSLAMLMGTCFAIGESFCGITPQRPLRVLVVQAENDEGDIAEILQGARKGLALEDFSTRRELAQTNIKICTVDGKLGQEFCVWLKREIQAFKADLVLVDPLLSFAGVDVARNDQASLFCRKWMNPVLRETGAVLLSVHHTGKPPRRDGRETAPQSVIELSYSGLGASELVNWARATMILVPVGDGAFKLVLAKRGKRAGACHPNGEPTDTIWLRHSTGKIFWEQVDPPDEASVSAKPHPKTKVEKVMESGLGPVIDTLTEPTGTRELERRIVAHAETKCGISISPKTGRDIAAILVHNNAIKRDTDGKYIKK